MTTEKKKHVYRATVNGTVVFARAHSRQQAVNAISARYIKVDRASADDVLDAGVKPEDVLDATAHPEQLPLQPEPTAAEVLEPGATYENADAVSAPSEA